MAAPKIEIRPIGKDERTGWEVLWQGYLRFYESSQAADATSATWLRMHDPAEPMHGLGAYVDGRLLGIVHYLFHRSFWTIGHYCYSAGLVRVGRRRAANGLGRALIESVYRACA